LQINGGGDFQISFFAFDKPDGQAAEFQELHVIGDISQGNGAIGEAFKEIRAAGDLRGLHGPQILTGDGVIDLGGQWADGLLDCEVDGQGRSGGAMSNGGGEGAVYHIG